jgi:hypothetical protein
MIADALLSPRQVDLARAAAAVLLPGSGDSPAPADLADFDELVQRSAAALGGEAQALARAVDGLPVDPAWSDLEALAVRDPASFEIVSLLVVGAYFMSPEVLSSLGMPSDERRAADREQVVDELGTGILDAVLERGCPVRTLEDVERAADVA